MYSEQDVKKVVSEVVSKYLTAKKPAFTGKREILLEVSARHVHLTEQAYKQLFGDEKVGVKKYLSQPGEFLSDKRVTLVADGRKLEKVAFLGPFRKAVQVELSSTDCKGLKIDAPVSMSGDLAGAGDIKIVGSKGEITARSCVIIAKAHIHLTPEDAKTRCLKNNQIVSVKIKSSRPVTLDGVVVRISEKFKEACHIDFDEANSACVTGNTTAEIVY